MQSDRVLVAGTASRVCVHHHQFAFIVAGHNPSVTVVAFTHLSDKIRLVVAALTPQYDVAFLDVILNIMAVAGGDRTRRGAGSDNWGGRRRSGGRRDGSGRRGGGWRSIVVVQIGRG